MADFTNKEISMAPLCGCCEGGCCTNRSCPSAGLPNPLPTSLTIEWTATFTEPPTGNPPGSGLTDPPNSNCFNFSMTVDLVEDESGTRVCVDDQIVSYFGCGGHTCTWCEKTINIQLCVSLQCNRRGGSSSGWILTLRQPDPPGDCDIAIGDDYRIEPFTVASCDPILLQGAMNKCISCRFAALGDCVIGQYPPEVPVVVLHPPFCLSALIYETP